MQTEEKAAAKAGETKPMSLQDLGLEDETTPAEKAKANSVTGESKIIERSDGVKIEQKSFINPEDAVEKPKLKVPRPETVQKTSAEMQTQHLAGDTRPVISISGHQPAKSEYQDAHVINGKPKDENAHALTEDEQKEAAVRMAGLTKGDDLQRQNDQLTVIGNLDQIAPRKKVENPIRKTFNKLHDMADKGIQRTEDELMAVGGRIEEAKEKYVESRYATLMERAKHSPNLKKKIEYYQQIMETDPTFDGSTDYMKKGYILFKVANDTSIGITDKSFGLAPESIKGHRRSSAENARTVQKIEDKANDTSSSIGDDPNHVILGDNVADDLPVRKIDDPISTTKEDPIDPIIKPDDIVDQASTQEDKADPVVAESVASDAWDDDIPTRSSDGTFVDESPIKKDPVVEEKEEASAPQPAVEEAKEPETKQELDITKEPAHIPEVDVKISELERGLVQPDESLSEEFRDQDPEEVIEEEMSETMRIYGLSEEDFRTMEMDYLKEVSRLIGGENKISDISKIASGSTLNLNAALKLMATQQAHSSSPRRMRSIWPLMFTGIPAEVTAFSGQELVQFNEDIEAFVSTQAHPTPDPTMAQLRSVFTLLHSHFANPNKGDLNTWLHKISANDFFGLVFSQYNAHFGHTNYLSYQCPKHGCSKLFLEKKPIMDMITFPNDKVKERFNAIMRKDTVLTHLYKTEPVPINEYFAVSFRTPSLYTMSFEPASLSKEFKEKHSQIVGMLPLIDRFWVIDNRNGGKKHPIDFGVVEKDLGKTVERKVNGILKIMTTFNMDQRAIIYGEYLKVIKNMQYEDVSYQLPATKCPVCGTEIPAEPADPINLLFMRARLSIEAASTPALL